MKNKLFDKYGECKILEIASILLEETEDGDFYTLYIDRNKPYHSTPEVVEEYTVILNEFKKILEDNGIQINDENNSDIMYRSYDIEIKKLDDGRLSVDTVCPSYFDIGLCYKWLRGVISQIDGLYFLY